MTATVTAVDTRRPRCCGLLMPLVWPAPRPGTRQLHRMLASLADLLDGVAAAHRLATELAALPDPPGQGWPTALTAIDAAAVGPTDTAALACQLTDHGMHEAANQLRRGLHHRLQALQRLRRTVPTSWPWPVALDHRHVAGLLAEVIIELDQAGQALAAADHALITAARKASLWPPRSRPSSRRCCAGSSSARPSTPCPNGSPWPARTGSSTPSSSNSSWPTRSTGATGRPPPCAPRPPSSTPP